MMRSYDERERNEPEYVEYSQYAELEERVEKLEASLKKTVFALKGLSRNHIDLLKFLQIEKKREGVGSNSQKRYGL